MLLASDLLPDIAPNYVFNPSVFDTFNNREIFMIEAPFNKNAKSATNWTKKK